jgi:hypothetical protein
VLGEWGADREDARARRQRSEDAAQRARLATLGTSVEGNRLGAVGSGGEATGVAEVQGRDGSES